MEGLRKQVSKLEEENTKLTKAEKQRRELELEVNYWKEYVTNQGKEGGAKFDNQNLLVSLSQYTSVPVHNVN